MTTNKAAITEGSGLNVATHSITEDAITKHLQRFVRETTAGAAMGVAGLPDVVRDDKANRLILVAGATLTRPANSTPYSINDSISDNGTAGSVTALTTNDLSDTNDAPVALSAVELNSNDTGLGGAVIRLFLFNSNPTTSSGVGAGDNATYSNKRAGFVGSFSGIMRSFSDGGRGVLVPDEGALLTALPASGAKNFWYQLQTLSAFTPSANSTTFIPTFRGYQGIA